MRKKGKRLLAILCIVVMGVTGTPISANADYPPSITIGDDTGNTLFGARKTLDLQSAGASVQFTDADREANTEEAAQEYDDIISETLSLFEPVYYDMAGYIQNLYSIDLTDDSGAISEDWPTKVTDTADKTAAEIIDEAWNIISDNEDVANLETTAENYFQENGFGDASNIPGSRMEKYLRYRYFKYLYPESSGDPKMGTVAWYQRYVKLESLKGNSSSTERTYFIKKRAVQLNSDTINERLQSVLSNAKFDFYLESFDSSEETANGIGNKIDLGGSSPTTVYNGGFSDSSASSVHLTSVDFSNEYQFYDSDLWNWKALPDFGDPFSNEILGEIIINNMPDGDDYFIDELSLFDHFFLFDGGSVESSGVPYLHKAGGLTYTSQTVWPYEIVYKSLEGPIQYRESLAEKYHIFGDDLSDSTDSLFSFSSIEIMYTHSLSSTGYDIYIPNFDSSGNIVSVSKPLFYELDDPFSPYEQQFDRDTLIASLDLDQDDDGTYDEGIYRYKMVEKTNDAKVNGHPVVDSSDYQIFDAVVVKNFDKNGNVSFNLYFFLYDDIDDMTDAYSKENVTYKNEFGTIYELGAIGYGFTINNYAPAVSVTLEAEKTVDGEVPDSDQTFEFQLIDEDGNVVSTATNEQGSVTFDPITLDGDDMGKTLTYTMSEVSSSEGSYTCDDSSYTAEVTVSDSMDENGAISVTSIVYKDSDGNVIDGLPVFNNETKPETATAASISIHATIDTYDADKSMFDQQDLTLFGFTLYAKSDIISAADGTTVLYKAGNAVSAEVSSDTNGDAAISGILPGEYVLKETKMPSGTAAATSDPEIRVAADESGSVSVYVNGQKLSSTDIINFENYVSKTAIEKKNESGEYVEGAALQLTDSDTGEVQDTWVTGTSAHKIAGLAFGHTYTLSETDAPDGYQKADDISFVPEGAAVQTIEMTDSKTQDTADDDDDDNSNNNENSSNNNNDNDDDNDSGDHSDHSNHENSNTATSSPADTDSENETTAADTGTDADSTVSESTASDSNDTSGGRSTIERVKTGDDSMLLEWTIVMAAASAALVIVLEARKRKKAS